MCKMQGFCLYGEETEKALENFALGEKCVNRHLILAMLDVKRAAIQAQKSLGMMDDALADAIIRACEEVSREEYKDQFCVHPLQGGAGTSTNMNVNEVVAAKASEFLGKEVLPLDDVNRGQSTNDVYPTALRVASIRLVRELSDACSRLQESLQKKEQEYQDIIKLGRTELMDAVPMTLGQEFGAYAQAIARDRWRIYKVEERLRQVNLGGTAIGTGSNAGRKYSWRAVENLRVLTGLGLARAEDPVDLTQNNDVFVEVSGLLKALAVNLIKIATDLRLMNSGPHGGLGEIHLKAMQKGSTIMPGKVNPVIPEMVTQVAIRVMANDQAVTLAAASGNFELNAFEPLIADALLESLEFLTKGVEIFREKCIEPLIADEKRCLELLEKSTVIVTALAPEMGYEKAAELVEESDGDPEKIREMLKGTKWESYLNYRKLMTYL